MKARMNTKVTYIAVDSTMYNGDRVRNCSHNNNNTTINNQNTKSISSNPTHSKVGMGMEVATKSIATDKSIFLPKTTPGRENVGV